VWVQRQVGTVSTACLGKVPGLLAHVGSAGGKVCGRSSPECGMILSISSWYFKFLWVKYGAGLNRFLPEGSLLRCQCTYALHRLGGPSNSDWRCCIHCLEHSFSRIFLYDFSRFCSVACCTDGGIGVCGSILSLFI